MSSTLCLLLILSLLSVTISSLGLPSILRAINTCTAAVDLNVTNFDAVLRDTPATYTLVEFFAHWCPACRNFKPHYEKVARLFNGPDAVYPGMVLMTRVDCASNVLALVLYLPFPLPQFHLPNEANKEDTNFHLANEINKERSTWWS